MPTFQYRAADAAGKAARGFIEAESKARAFFLLQEKGLTPYLLAPVGEKAGKFAAAIPRSLRNMFPGQRFRLSESFYYLGLMLQTGSSLVQSLELLGRITPGKGGRIWLDVRDAVAQGRSFSEAMKTYPDIFPHLYTGMVEVAEESGSLGRILEKAASYEESRREVSGKLLTALIYPAVIMLVGLGAVFFLLSNVLPKIASVIAGSGRILPVETRLLLACGTFLKNWGLLIFILFWAGVFVLVYCYKNKEQFRERIDRALWRLPLTVKVVISRFSSLLGFQLESGIPLVRAVENAARATPSLFFRAKVMEAGNEVAAGEAIEVAFAKREIFPELFILTLSTGRKAGKLAKFLNRLALILEREADETLKRAASLAEPLLILATGMVVGFIVLAIMGPIFDLSTVIK